MAAHFTAGESDVELPPSWETMPKDSSGKEIGCHLVDLQPSDPEYQEVLAAITSTMPSQETIYDSFGPELDIVKMQRIQNPTLYAQYASRKKAMEKENPDIKIESWLFHKCYNYSHSVAKNIFNQGFNKSIAGPNCKC